MSRFPILQDPKERQELRALYEEITAAGSAFEGAPLNFFTAMSLRPDLLRGAWALTKATLKEGRLSPVLQNLILVAIAARNESHYCCLTHARALRGLGVDEAVIQSALEDPDLAGITDPTRAALRFAVEVAIRPNELTAGHFAMMARSGFSRELVLEIVLLAAFANWSNTWSNAADLVVEGSEAKGA